MNSQLDSGDIRGEAADWVIALHYESQSAPPSGDNVTLHADFANWVRQSPQHLSAFMAADDQFCELEGMDRARRINVESLLSQATSSENPSSQASHSQDANRRWRVPRLPRWAAIMLVLTVGAIAWIAYYEGNVFRTQVGEQRVMVLPDGSSMTLNTDSRARVEFTKSARRIRLLKGEALFSVEHDTKRPFYVITPSAVVRAVGTQFDVYQRDEVTTTITVIEGVVRYGRARPSQKGSVGPTTVAGNADDAADRTAGLPATQAVASLAAGQQAQISQSEVTTASSHDTADAIAWRDRLLVFHGDALVTVAAEFNRYNPVKLRIADTETGQLRLSGTYALDRPQIVAQYLQLDPSLSVEKREREWVIRKR